MFSDGTTADVTEQATWTTDNPAVAIVPAGLKGLVRTVSLGSANVTATLGPLSVSDGFQTIAGATLVSRNATNDGPADRQVSASVNDTNGDYASRDGRFVVFVSNAGNLLPAGPPIPLGTPRQIFVRDRQLNTTTLVSIDSTGTAPANGTCDGPSITPDGRFVLFSSNATNLAPTAGGFFQVYRRDLLTNTTILVSRNGDPVPAEANADATQPGGSQAQMSADGSIVAFLTIASNMPTTGSGAQVRLIVRNLLTGSVSVANLNPDGTLNPSLLTTFSMSDSGNVIAFGATEQNFVGSDARSTVLVRNLATATTTDAGFTTDGKKLFTSLFPVLRSDGREVLFFAAGVPNNANQAGTFAKNLEDGSLTFVDSATTLQMSADGRFLIVQSGADGFFTVSAPVLLDRATGGRSSILVDSAGLARDTLGSLGNTRMTYISPSGGDVFNFTVLNLDPLVAPGNTTLQVYRLPNPFLP